MYHPYVVRTSTLRRYIQNHRDFERERLLEDPELDRERERLDELLLLREERLELLEEDLPLRRDRDRVLLRDLYVYACGR